MFKRHLIACVATLILQQQVPCMAGAMPSHCDCCCAASNAPHPAQSDPAGLCTASLEPHGGSEPSGPTRGSTKAEKEWAMPLDWVLCRLYLRLAEASHAQESQKYSKVDSNAVTCMQTALCVGANPYHEVLSIALPHQRTPYICFSHYLNTIQCNAPRTNNPNAPVSSTSEPRRQPSAPSSCQRCHSPRLHR